MRSGWIPRPDLRPRACTDFFPRGSNFLGRCPVLNRCASAKKFTRFIEAYLTKYPSRSFTPRNLGARLPQFVHEMPALTAPHTALAMDIARFEWSQTVAFDEAGGRRVTAAQVRGWFATWMELGWLCQR